jgi:hypothetical protein
MNTKLVKILGAVLALLMLVIAAEWVYAKKAQQELLETASAIKPEEYQADELPVIDLTEQTEDTYADLVDRPLFIKGRRHVEEVPPESEQTAPAAAENFDWQLNGVYSGKSGLTALFSRVKTRVPKDNYRRLQVGADLDGWKLNKIENDKVLLKQGDNPKELPLRKIKPKEAKGIPPNAPGMPIHGNAPGQQMPRPGMPVPPPDQQGVPVEPTADPFENSTNE